MPTAASNPELLKLTRELLTEIVSQIDWVARQKMTELEQRRDLREAAQMLLEQRAPNLTPTRREQVIHMLTNEVFGLGPLEELVNDPSVSDILINGPHEIYVEREGMLQKVDAQFVNKEHLMTILQRVVNRLGKLIDETHPMVDARLPDGSRLNAVIHPLARTGPLVSIRRFPKALTPWNLIQSESVTPQMLDFLRACVTARLNILVSGGTGSGKTTLLNVLSSFIPPNERIITIEDAAELQLQQPHVLPLESKPPNIEGSGEVTQRDLVRNALRMRPDRILVGECRGGEALDMLQAMNTGHDGSLTTIHANSTRDALTRLEMLVEMAGIEIPIRTIRRQISTAIQIVVQTARLRGGARKVMAITEICGVEGDDVLVQDLFRFQRTGVDSAGNQEGYFTATGHKPYFSKQFEEAGIELPDELFHPTPPPTAESSSS